MPHGALVNFVSGETSPKSRGRIDLEWYRSSAERMENFAPGLPGEVTARSGFRFVAQTRGGAEARLVPFVINADQKYLLVFTPGKMRVIKDGALMTKTPYNLLTATTLLDDFSDGNYTANPAWTPYVAARVSISAGALLLSSTGAEGGAASTPQTRNIGVFQFDAEIASYGTILFFGTTYTPTTNANGVVGYAATGYAVRRAGSTYKFGRLSGGSASTTPTFTELLDLGQGSAGVKQFKFVRQSTGVWECYAGTVGSLSLIGTVSDTTYATTTVTAVHADSGTYTVSLDNVYIPGAGAADNQGVITGLTNATPPVVTLAAVGDFADGDEAIIADVLGMWGANGRQVLLANNSGTTFALKDAVTSGNLASTNWGVYSSGGRLKEIYEIDTPYYASDLADLSWVASGRDGVLYIAHKKYALRKLSVDSADNFTLSTYARTNDPFTNTPQTLQITGIDRSATGTLIYFTTGSVINTNATYTFASVGGTTQLNAGTYRLRIPTGAFQTPRAYLVTTTGDAEVDSSSWSAYTSGGTATPDAEHPISVAMYESRLCVLGTSVRPNTFFASRGPSDSGAPRYDDFTGGTDPDHACFFALAPTNGQIDAPAWLRGTSRYLMAGTFGGPFRISGAGLDEPIAPDSVNVRQFDDAGCEAVMPASAAGQVFWLRRGGRALMTAAYSQAADDYRATDLLVNAEHIAAESRLKRVIYRSGRPDTLFAVREDGVLCGVTISSEERVSGWYRYIVGGPDGMVLDAQVLPRTDKDDELWVVVQRTVNGATRCYVEVLTDAVVFPERADFYTADNARDTDTESWENVVYRRQEEYVHLDAAGTYDGSDRGVAAGASITPSAVSGASVTITASASVFRSTDVGLEIWRKPDRETGAGGGKALITGYTSPTQVTVEVDSDVPFDSVSAIPAGDWYFAAKTIYGLWFVDTASVTVVDDGGVYSDEQVAVTDGKLVLDEFAAVVHVGFAYNCVLKTHNLNLSAAGPNESLPRAIAQLRVRFLDTLGVSYGTDMYELEHVEWRDPDNDAFDRPSPVFSGIRVLSVRDSWGAATGSPEEREKHVVVCQRLPLPCTIQGITIEFEGGD